MSTPRFAGAATMAPDLRLLLDRWRGALARGPVPSLDEIVQSLDGPGLEVRDPGLEGRYLPASRRGFGEEDHPARCPLDDLADALWPADAAADPVAEAWLRTALEAARQLQAGSWTDALTGLFNRRGLHGFLGHHLRLAERRRDPVAVLVLDLVGFREVNRREGHAAGDAVLIKVAAQFQSALRESDVAARPGGDEFVAILPGCDVAGAAQVSARVRATLGHPARMGVAAQVTGANCSVADLLDRADAAMRMDDMREPIIDGSYPAGHRSTS